VKYNYIVYKTVNIITEDYYVGVHKTLKLDDDYRGSGTRLIRSIKKYGKGNFKRSNLFVFNTKKEAYKKEFEIVNKEMLSDYKCLNIKLGGNGGFDHLVGNKTCRFYGKKHKKSSMIQMVKTRINNNTLLRSKEAKKKMKKNHWSRTRPEDFKLHVKKLTHLAKTNKRTRLTIEVRRKISESLMGKKHDRVKCPYCSKVGGCRVMKRHHFERCKLK